VMPSGTARASVWSPMIPPAPGWFSITAGAVNAFDTAGPNARVVAPTPEPAAVGSTSLTPPVCAKAAGASAAASTDRAKSRRFMVSPPGVFARIYHQPHAARVSRYDVPDEVPEEPVPARRRALARRCVDGRDHARRHPVALRPQARAIPVHRL